MSISGSLSTDVGSAAQNSTNGFLRGVVNFLEENEMSAGSASAIGKSPLIYFVIGGAAILTALVAAYCYREKITRGCASFWSGNGSSGLTAPLTQGVSSHQTVAATARRTPSEDERDWQEQQAANGWINSYSAKADEEVGAANTAVEEPVGDTFDPLEAVNGYGQFTRG